MLKLPVSIAVQAYGTGSPVIRVTAWQTKQLDSLENVSTAYPARLLWWDEAPAVLQFNPYVKHGYRAGQSDCHLRPVVAEFLWQLW